MSDLAREKLKEIIQHEGREIIKDPAKCEALLRDSLPKNWREIHLLTAFLREGLGDYLLRGSKDRLFESMLGHCRKRLIDSLGITPEFANWTVITWALSLGVISEEPSLHETERTPSTNQNEKAQKKNQREPEASSVASSASFEVAGKCSSCGEVVLATWKVCPVCAVPIQSVLTPKKPPEINDQDLFTKTIRMKLRLIQPGSFKMGSSKKFNYEKPVHRVTISKPFYIGVYPVAQKEYQRVMGNNPSHFIGVGRPVELVSWLDADQFCKKLSEIENRLFRLPTEAEWEYACRAGTEAEYYWGSLMNRSYCWYSENSWNETHEVGKKWANPWGLYDMLGNVWEWCEDKYDDSFYEKCGSCTDPRNDGTSSKRVLRGGCWYNSTTNCRCAARDGIEPSEHNYGIGFRIVSPGDEILISK